MDIPDGYLSDVEIRDGQAMSRELEFRFIFDDLKRQGDILMELWTASAVYANEVLIEEINIWTAKFVGFCHFPDNFEAGDVGAVRQFLAETNALIQKVQRIVPDVDN